MLRDVLSFTIGDPLHSSEESRFVTIGQSQQGRILVVVPSEVGDTIRIVSAIMSTLRARRGLEEMLPEYDFASMKDGVRGKSASRFAEGTSMVVLDRDVAKIFPDGNSVIGIGAAVTRRPLPHHRAYGSVHGGSSRLR